MSKPGGAEHQSRLAFGERPHYRIAHGLFALRDGMFLEIEIPHDQMQPPEVRGFLERLIGETGAPLSVRPHVSTDE